MLIKDHFRKSLSHVRQYVFGVCRQARLLPRQAARGVVFWPLMALAAVLLYRGELPAVYHSGTSDRQQADTVVITDLAAPPAMFGVAAPAPEPEEIQAASSAVETVATADSAAEAAIGSVDRFSPENGVRPVNGSLVRRQGWQRHPLYGDWRLMPGVDLQAVPGETIRAAYEGLVASVVKSTHDGLWQVIMAHGVDWTSEYAGLAAVAVTPGQKVPAGGQLGKTGTDGNCVVTFVLRNNEALVDPAPYLGD